MAQIGDIPAGQSTHDYMRDVQRSEQHIDDLVRSIRKDARRAVELTRLQVRELSPAARQKVAELVAEQLKGQIPPQVAKSLIGGNVDAGLLESLAKRLGNANSSDPNARLGIASTPDSAREAAADPNLPQQALRWARFVQRPQNVPGGGIQGRAGSAAPKGEGTTLAELIASQLAGREGPGLRNPRLVQRAMSDLSPQQRATLMEATFGKGLAAELQKLGITDPLMLVQAGALPTNRASLAAALHMPRGRLLAHLMRAELLKIGPGRNGEIGISPHLLGPLSATGIAMLGTLAALRGLSADELAYLYRKLRLKAGGFKLTLKGGRVPVKRDLIHWARSAARRRSDILLADSEEFEGGSMGHADAEELVQAWYLENLLWQELAASRRSDAQRAANREQQRIDNQRLRESRDQERRERQQREQTDQDQREREEREAAEDNALRDDVIPQLAYDQQRSDQLMCFWITDFGTDPLMPTAMRRMYVCIDPTTGAIIPQSIEQEVV